MSSPQASWNRRTRVVAGILSIATVVGIASIATTTREGATDPAGQELATPGASPLDAILRLDHSVIRTADAMEPDSTGASIAAYE